MTDGICFIMNIQEPYRNPYQPFVYTKLNQPATGGPRMSKKNTIHNYLTDDEVYFIRDQLAELRSHGAHKPEKWFVSGFNRAPEALGLDLPDHMPSSVVIKDITLRVAEQTSGLALSFTDRRRIARALVEAGVPAIQLSVLLWNVPDDELREEIQILKGINPDIEIEMGGPDHIEAIDQVADIGIDWTRVTLPSFFALGPVYRGTVPKLAWQGRDWRREVNPPKNLEEAVERNKRLIDHAHKRGLKMQADISMLLYATAENLEEFAGQMANAGADGILLADGPGGMGPHAIAYAVSIVRKAAPNVRIAIHLHNTFGLGVGLCVAAVQAGADVVETSINGTGCGSGQVDLAHVATSMEVLYGVDTGIRLEKLTELRRLYEDITKVPVARNHPITGEEAFNWGGPDLLTQELPVDMLIHWCIEPEVVGNKRKWEVDRTSGPWSMHDKLTELEIDASKEETEAILKAIHEEILLRKRSMTDDDIRNIAMEEKERMAKAS